MLEAMAAAYPDRTNIEPDEYPEVDLIDLSRNLCYLWDSGLCMVREAETLRSQYRADFSWPVITNKGLDFLQDDGGLSAILNVVTVRFEADTLRALIAAKIDASSEPEEKKAKAKGVLSTLREEGLKQLTNKAVGEGLSSLPHIADWVISAI